MDLDEHEVAWDGSVAVAAAKSGGGGSGQKEAKRKMKKKCDSGPAIKEAADWSMKMECEDESAERSKPVQQQTPEQVRTSKAQFGSINACVD